MEKPNQESLKLFHHYLIARETVRVKKERGEPFPWTTDTILQKYKFTNVKREFDKTTRHFKENFYDQHRNDPGENGTDLKIILLNCAIFRYFGTIEFADALGWQRRWEPENIVNTAKERIEQKKKVFTGAYVITNQGIKAPKEEVVVYRFLKNFYEKTPDLLSALYSTNLWREVFLELSKVEGFRGSGFMAKEVLLDAMLTPVLEEVDDRDTWCPCTVGSMRGLNRIFERDKDKKIKENQAQEEMRFLRDEYFRVKPNWMPELAVRDVVFSLCEFDKYLRIMYGEGKVRSSYKPPQTQRNFFSG